MALRPLGTSMAALIVVAASLAYSAVPARAQTPPLFSNYYAPDPACGAHAAMYVSPRPTPPLVGHTWVTYQPFMPHEYLYRHHRAYYTPYPTGYTKTSVSWGSDRALSGLKKFFIGHGPVEWELGVNNIDWLTTCRPEF